MMASRIPDSSETLLKRQRYDPESFPVQVMRAVTWLQRSRFEKPPTNRENLPGNAKLMKTACFAYFQRLARAVEVRMEPEASLAETEGSSAQTIADQKLRQPIARRGQERPDECLEREHSIA